MSRDVALFKSDLVDLTRKAKQSVRLLPYTDFFSPFRVGKSVTSIIMKTENGNSGKELRWLATIF